MNRIKLLTLISFLFFNLNLVFSQAPTSVFFDSGKSDLKPESEAVLKSLVEKILTYADVDLRIEAFTDDKGSESFNQQLAQQRAETVRNYLLSRRIVPQKLDVRPIGELSVDAKEADIEESRRKKTLYGFGKAPSELNFTLVSIKLKDGFPYISVQNVNSATAGAWVPDYKKVTVPELKEVLASL